MYPRTGGDHPIGRVRSRTHVARHTDGVNHQLPQREPPQDPHVPAQPGRDEDESTSNDFTADRLLAIIRSEVERLVSPSTVTPTGDREQPTSELQLPVTSTTGRVRQGVIMH